MGFLGSIFGGGSGGSFQAQENPNSVQNLQDQYGVVQNVENQLQGVASGNPNNPVAAQSRQMAAQNAQNAAQLINSQKGLNPALAARLGGQQLQAANQGAASLTSQQQLGALGQLSNTAVNQQQVTQGGISSANAANAGIQQGNQSAQQGLLGGAGALLGLADGGLVPGADPFAQSAPVLGAAPQQGSMSRAGSYLSQNLAPRNPLQGLVTGIGHGIASIFSGSQDNAPAAPAWGSNAEDYKTLGTGSSIADYTSLPDAPAPQMAKGGRVPAMVSPGEVYIPPSKVKEAAKSDDPRKSGKEIPGAARVKGDSLKNDTVPATLESGGIVLPRSVMQAKDPAAKAHEFVTAVLAKKGLRSRR